MSATVEKLEQRVTTEVAPETAKGGHLAAFCMKNAIPRTSRKVLLLLARKSEALLMVADEAPPHPEGILTEFGVGAFDLALEKLLADHAGTTNSLWIPYVK
jgi:hypothetical protein